MVELRMSYVPFKGYNIYRYPELVIIWIDKSI